MKSTFLECQRGTLVPEQPSIEFAKSEEYAPSRTKGFEPDASSLQEK